MLNRLLLLSLLIIILSPCATHAGPKNLRKARALSEKTTTAPNVPKATAAPSGAGSSTPGDPDATPQLTAMAWGRYQVTHTYYTTIPYNGHQVLVYQQQPGADQANSTDGLLRFFYQPALILDVDGITTSYNPFSLQQEVIIPVLMWNDEYEGHVRGKLTQKVGNSSFLLSMIPVEGIRVKATGPNKALAINNRWVSYSSQPSMHTFRVNCVSRDACIDLVKKIQDDPHQFTDDLRVYYSLEGQSSMGKRITVKAEHIQQSSMFSELKQRIPNKNPIYLTADDANKMQNEIANNIMATEVQDEDFVSDESSPTLMALITKALDFTMQSSAGFDKEAWSSTFWKDENARPDKVTERVNEAYNKMQDEERKAFKQEVSKEKGKSQSTQIGVSLPGTVDLGAGQSSNENVASASTSSGDNYKKLAKEASQSSEWSGESFTPKAQDLRRVNVGSVSTGTTFTTSQLRIARATSQISDQIKVMKQAGIRSYRGSREVFHVVATGANPFFFKKDAKELCVQLGAQLATLRQLEEAWIDGAEWCSSGHLDAGYVGYPGAICYDKKKSDKGATLHPFQYEVINCSLPLATKNTYIYKAGDGNEETVQNWQFGANCWGAKPVKGKEYSYRGRPLNILQFNSLSYSQYAT